MIYLSSFSESINFWNSTKATKKKRYKMCPLKNEAHAWVFESELNAFKILLPYPH